MRKSGMGNKMKVLIGSHGYPSTEYPMNAIHEMVYARALKKAGIDVFVGGLDMRSFRRKRKFGYDKTIVAGIPVYNMNIPVGAVDARIMGRIAAYGLKKLLPRIIKEEGEPDIIHSHFSDTSYAYAKLIKGKYPLVITEHFSQLNKEKKEDIKKGLYEISKYAYDHCDRLIIGSPFYKERIEKNFDVESQYIPILTPTSVFKTGEGKSPYFKIVSTGNLKEGKGHRDAIRAFSKAFKGENAKFFIYGKGEDRSALEEIIKENNLEDQVILKGQTSLTDIAEEYLDADLFLFASHSETFGKAVVEAMKAGLPVLSTKNGGSEQFIEEFNGRLVSVGDIDALSNQLLWFREHIDKFDKGKISQYIIENFSEEEVIKRVIRVYDDLLGVQHGK